jgi:hypothetical protein
MGAENVNPLASLGCVQSRTTEPAAAFFYWVSTGASTCFALRFLGIGRNWHHLLQYDEWCLNPLFPLQASLKQHTTKGLSFFSLSSSALYVFFFFWVAWSQREQAASLANGPGPPMAARPRPTSWRSSCGPSWEGCTPGWTTNYKQQSSVCYHIFFLRNMYLVPHCPWN